MHLLAVCTGNICRSPTVERLVRAYATDHGLSALSASSAGTRAVVGAGVAPHAAAVLTGLGGDPAGFRAHQLTGADVRAADLVLALTTRHREQVLALEPRAMRRTFTLREASRLLERPGPGATVLERLGTARAARGLGSDTDDDVTDPYGRAPELYVEVGALVARALLPLLDALAAELG